MKHFFKSKATLFWSTTKPKKQDKKLSNLKAEEKGGNGGGAGGIKRYSLAIDASGNRSVDQKL